MGVRVSLTFLVLLLFLVLLFLVLLWNRGGGFRVSLDSVQESFEESVQFFQYLVFHGF